jgi:hypothetical protein
MPGPELAPPAAAAPAEPNPVGEAGPPAPSGEDVKPKLTSAQFAALRRSQREVKQLRGQADAWASQRQDYDTKLAELQRQVKEATEGLAAAKSDPMGWAVKSGVDPNDAIRKYLGEGTPERAISEAREEAKAAREELKKYIEEQKKLGEEQQRQAAERHDQSIISGYVNTIRANRKEWPYTNAALSEQEIRQKLQELHQIGKKMAESYTPTQIKNAFERLAKQKWESMQETARELLQDSSTNGQASGAPTAQRAGIRSTAAATQPPGKTSIPPAPMRKKPLTPAEQKAADLALIKSAMDKDRAARRPAAKPATPAAPPKPGIKPQRAHIRH